MRLTGKQRRRIARLVRRIAEEYGCIFLHHQPEFRDARRIGALGLACPVITKSRPWMPSGIGEMALYPTRKEAAKRYPSWAIFPRTRRDI